MTDDPECPLTELPASMCACRNHRGGSVVVVETVGPAFSAQFEGACEKCSRRIWPGDQIMRLADGGGYAHSGRCPGA